MRIRPSVAPLLILGAGVLGMAGDPSGAARSRHPGLLVLAPARFELALRPYLEHKRATYAVEYESLEQVRRRAAGSDDAEKVKRFIDARWRRDGLGYVLLVGDADVFPVRYMVLDRVTPEAFDYAFYPSDLYYADLARANGTFDDWNARRDGFHDGYVGEVRGEKHKNDPINFDAVDYRPEVAVGRWPVSEVAELSRLIAKSIRYERAVTEGRHPGLGRAALLGVGGWVDSRGLLRRAAERIAGAWRTELLLYADDPAVSTEAQPTERNLEGLLHRGVGLVAHAGHGTDDSWEQCFFRAHLDRLHNADRLPILISAGCSTARLATLPPYEAYLDVVGREHPGTTAGEVFREPPPPPACYQTGRFNPTGLGEQLLRAAEGGAVAYIGCNTGSQPCALTLLDGFLTAAAAPSARLGDCWVAAVRHYWDHEKLGTLKPTPDWYPASIFFQGMKFMVFGDPTLPLAGPRRRP